MKIRIVGPCGSGKSSLARELSKEFNIPYYEIDNMIWDRSEEDLRYPEEVRNATFFKIIQSESWIVEGAQSKWTGESFGCADIIFILVPNVWVRDYRIIKRFIRSRTGIEAWNYKQTFSNLIKMMVEWNHRYDLKEVSDLTQTYSNKRFYIKNKKDAIKHIQDYIGAARKDNDIA
ncbi:MAG: hypothetical protein ACQEXX_18175 [Bacillota bacterium]